MSAEHTETYTCTWSYVGDEKAARAAQSRDDQKRAKKAHARLAKERKVRRMIRVTRDRREVFMEALVAHMESRV